jgi:two-component system cell cycle sensor histidine kinase/response regulator CckA
VAVLTAHLKRAGFRVISAPSGDHAVAALKAAGRAAEHAITLLVTDLDMPGRNGRQLAAEMRRHHPELKVLYVTANPDGLFVPGQLLGAGESFLEKPVTQDLLRESINFLLHS